MSKINDDSSPEEIREMWQQYITNDLGLAEINLGQVAYIKEVQVKNMPAFVIYEADGTPISLQDSFNDACLLILEHGLDIATLH